MKSNRERPGAFAVVKDICYGLGVLVLALLLMYILTNEILFVFTIMVICVAASSRLVYMDETHLTLFVRILAS